MPSEEEARRRRREVARRIEPLYSSLSPAELAAGSDDAPDTFAHGLYLGVYSAAGLMRSLQHYGVLPLVEVHGFTGLHMEIDLSDPFLHVARLKDGADLTLLDLRTRLVLGKDTGAPGRLGELTFLDIEWLSVEDPRQGFSPSRPALPGQRHPGLGIGPELEELMLLVSRRLGAAGIVAHPQWVHNAALYHPRWQFADAAEEGRLAAMMRDLGGYSLPQVSWGVYLGCVNDENGRTVEWNPGVQVLPRTHEARKWFTSARYRAGRFTAKAVAAYNLDERLLKERLAERGIALPG